MKLEIHDHRNAAKVIAAATLTDVKAAVSNATSLKKATPARDCILTKLRNQHENPKAHTYAQRTIR